MMPDDEDELPDEQPEKEPKVGRIGVDVVRAFEARRLGKMGIGGPHLRAYAEDELVRKEYKEMKCEMPGLPRSTFLMVFSPDGTKVASTHGNHNIYVTDIRSGKNIRTLIGHPRTPWCIAFHPTSNQILASGCLGGQVRIWDLSGGSEVWMPSCPSVIASIAFHPIDRVLVIATYNEVYFWDWSKPEPFVHVTTRCTKEKVRYVAFDKLGHKLITGIANSPQTKWERVRAPVPVPRQAERSASPYRQRITPRIIIPPSSAGQAGGGGSGGYRSGLADVTERERRISTSYRNLVREYELLVHRYMQIYRPPAMIDRGTDPMETYPSSSPSVSTSSSQTPTETPSTSSGRTSTDVAEPPIRVFRLIRPTRETLIRGTQTTSSPTPEPSTSTADSAGSSTEPIPGPSRSPTENPRKTLVLMSKKEPQTSVNVEPPTLGVKMRIKCTQRRKSSKPFPPRKMMKTSAADSGPSNTDTDRTTEDNEQPSTSEPQRRKQGVRREYRELVKTDIRNRIMPIINSIPPQDRPDLLRLFRHKQQHIKMQLKRMYLGSGRRPAASSSDSSSDDEAESQRIIKSTTRNLQSEAGPSTSEEPSSSGQQNPESSTSNFNIIIEHLVTNLLSDSSNNREQSSVESSSSPQTPSSPWHRVSLSNSDNPQPFSSGGRTASAFIRPRSRSPRQSRPYWLNSSVRNRPHNFNFLAEDEVINFSERAGSEDDPSEPPVDLPAISPENIGIGNMYLNIVQDLESSLNDVRNIRASNRPGETSDMLSSFSGRLESIMNQSDTILRNLSQSMDMLRTTERNSSILEDNFYIRDNSRPYTPPDSSRPRVVEYADQRGAQYVTIPQNGAYNPLTSDHTYPRNPENQGSSDNMTPLMTSLHLTISHIQRQASLLREQVESIERIDRAMLEVSQLQVIRQLFVDMYRYMSNLPNPSATSTRNPGVSSVRHMMAGTRISDSTTTPHDSSADDQSSPAPQNTSSEPEPVASTSRQPDLARPRPSRTRSARKTYPPSRFFRMQRQGRHQNLANFLGRRYSTRGDQRQRRSGGGAKYGAARLGAARTLDFTAGNPQSSIPYTGPTADTLRSMTMRLEWLLMDQTRYGLMTHEHRSVSANMEQVLRTNLYRCRARMNIIMGVTSDSNEDSDAVTVTSDGAIRFTSRNTLVGIIDNLTRFLCDSSSALQTQSVQNQIQGILGLSLLVSEILLLRIVDSIPPPTRGAHLDPERESLTARIDQMCTQMLHSRLSGQNHQLTRSLRLMRLTVQHATSALNHTYSERRNSLPLPRTESRRAMVDRLFRRFQSIQERRHPLPDWNYVLADLIGRFTREDDATEESNLNAETGEQIHGPSAATASNSDDNEDNVDANTRSSSSTDPGIPLYRTSNVNLLGNEGSSTSIQPSHFRVWNVPTVQVNDVPISESSSMFHPRFWTRHRLSELRSASSGLFRPRFLHPLYAGVNPFETDLDDTQREHVYDNDIMITTVTPNHRIQVWDMSKGEIPVINNPLKNVVVSECKIHNDASVDVATDGTILVTLLPSGGYLNVTNRLGVYSLRWETLGQCLYITSFEQNAVSVSLSPLSRHLVVGLASRRVSIVPSEKWTLARIFLLDDLSASYSPLTILREIEQTRDSRATSYKSVNCIRWLPVSGQGLVYATNTGQLIFLT